MTKTYITAGVTARDFAASHKGKAAAQAAAQRADALAQAGKAKVRIAMWAKAARDLDPKVVLSGAVIAACERLDAAKAANAAKPAKPAPQAQAAYEAAAPRKAGKADPADKAAAVKALAGALASGAIDLGAFQAGIAALA